MTTRIEQVVSPGLEMEIDCISFDSGKGAVSAWVFVTRGLVELGHRELIFAVKVRPDESLEDYPAEVSELLRGVFGAARRGETVDVGGRTVFNTSSKSFLDRKDIGGIVYTWVPRALEDIAPRDALLGVFLTEHEMAVANEYGHTRVLGLLGEESRHYPTAPWLDRDRMEALRPDDMSSSLIGKVARIRLSRSTAFMTIQDQPRKVLGTTAGLPDFTEAWRNGPLTLQLEWNDAPRLKAALEAIPLQQPFAIMASARPTVAHCMVWNPKSGRTAVIVDSENHADPRYTGNFILFCGEQAQSSVNTIEDGFGLLLADTDLGPVRRALAGDALSISDAAGSALFEIRPHH